MMNDYFPWPSTDPASPLPEGWSVYIVEGEPIEAPTLQDAIECFHILNESAS